MVFGVIFTLILISALVIFASIILNDMYQAQIYAQIEEAKDDLGTVVSYFFYNTGTGSTDDYTLSIPSGSKFCFVNVTDPSPQISKGWNPSDIVPGYITENEWNLWIYYPDGDQDGASISHLTVSDDFGNFCAENGAKLQLLNAGTIVEVSIKE